MTRTVTKKLMYLDATGKPHPYRSWAEQANLWAEMLELFEDADNIRLTSDEIVNRISGNAKLVRDYLDTCDQMQKDVFA